jgi:amino acid permease
MVLLLEAKRMVARETLQQYIRYDDIATHAYGPGGGAVLYLLTVAASLGVAAANLTFVGSTLLEMLESDYQIEGMKSWYFTVGALAFVAPLTFLRSFKILGYASVVGNFCLLAGIVGTVAIGGTGGPEPPSLTMFDISEIPKSMGTVSFVFCINFLLLPIERSMQEHASFPKLLTVSVVGAATSIIGFGIAGHVALFLFFFGWETQNGPLARLCAGAPC